MKRTALIMAAFVLWALFAPPAAYATGKVVTIGTRVIGNRVPWSGGGTAMRFQCLWLKSEINVPGYINVVEFAYSSGASTGGFNNVRVSLCHTTKTGLEPTFYNNYAGKTPVLVLDKLSLVLSGTAWMDIGIDADKFNYDNQDNLLMEIRWRGASGNSIYCWRSNMTAGRVYAYNDEAAVGTVYDEGQYIRLHINTMAGVEPTSLGRVRALYR
ncbi:MAG TPA: hypothetical protein VMW93_04885 [bacterium]|nr:hypothetical protein [bacterium]